MNKKITFLDNKDKEELQNQISQSNWEQNDSTKPDYVKNRTHYIKKSAKEFTASIDDYGDSDLIKVSDDIVDTTDSIIVVDEGFMYLVKSIKYAHCIFWWLSVDNFFLDPDQLPYHCLSNIYKWNKRSIIQVIKTIVLKKMYYRCLITPKFKIKDLIDRNAINSAIFAFGASMHTFLPSIATSSSRGLIKALGNMGIGGF